MLYYQWEGSKLRKKDFKEGEERRKKKGEEPAILLATEEEAEVISAWCPVPKEILDRLIHGNQVLFENYEGVDLFVIPWDSIALAKEEEKKLIFILTQNHLMIIVRAAAIKKLEERLLQLTDNEPSITTPDRLIYRFLAHSMQEEHKHLDRLEEKINDMEKQLLLHEIKHKDFLMRVVEKRKRLQRIENRYEELMMALEEADTNENGFLDEKTLRSLKTLYGRVDRLYHKTVAQRDYLTQIREAWQTQQDIHLNQVMEFFTVAAVIFLPLTLITSWYGMNFKYMPELSSPFGYPAVILTSIGVVALFISYFKRKNWFF